MKKLMIAAAAAVCGSVFALESANVVGYSNKALTQGKFKVICTQFQTVGVDADKMTLGDFVPGGTWALTDSIKIFADNSAVEMEAIYVDEANLVRLQSRYPDATVGWYSKADKTYSNNLNTKAMPLGTSVMAYTSKATSYITFAGQVVTTEDDKITYTLTQGKFAMVGNCTPVDLTLGDFVPGGAWALTDSIKIFADNSAVEMEAIYVDEANLVRLQTRFPDATVGWYSKADKTYSNNLNTRPVAAGEGFMAYTSKVGATISIPTAL